MSIEQYQPRETDEQARLRVISSMMMRYETYERCDLGGLFKKINEKDIADEV